MLTKEWKQIMGLANIGDDEEAFAAKQENDITEIAFMAYGGVKIIEVEGLDDIGRLEDPSSELSMIMSEWGDDWEAAIPIVKGDNKGIVVFDELGNCGVIVTEGEDGSIPTPNVTGSMEYDAEECAEEVDDSLMEIFHIL